MQNNNNNKKISSNCFSQLLPEPSLEPEEYFDRKEVSDIAMVKMAQVVLKQTSKPFDEQYVLQLCRLVHAP